MSFYKKHLLKEPKYINCRCRKCNQLIGFKCISKERSEQVGPHGIIITKKFSHENCTIEDGEEVYCDLVSISDHIIHDLQYIVYTEEYNEDEFVKEEE